MALLKKAKQKIQNPGTRNRKPKEENIMHLDRNERVKLLHANGLKPKEIAEETGIPLSTVYRYLRKKKKPGPKQFKKRNKKIMKKVDSGESQADVGREFGLSRQRVHVIHKNN